MDKPQIINLERGIIPPQAVEIEEIIIGALMVDTKGMYDVADILFDDVFYKDSNKTIFSAIKHLFQESKPIDLLTISDRLREMGKLESVGGDFALIKLTQKVATSAHIEYHSRIVLQKYIQRSLIRISNKIIEDAYNDGSDVLKLLDEAYSDLNSITEQTIKKSNVSFGDLVDSRIKQGRDVFKGDIKPGIDTPIKKLTLKTGGWRKGELIILAARPGMGKTAFAISIAKKASIDGTPSMIFSLEMSSEKFTDRILSMGAKIDGDKFNIHGLSEEDEYNLEPTVKQLKSLPFHIDDTASMSIESFQVKAKVAKRKHNIGLIVIDYIQLMSATSGNREQEISKISRGLKQVALELEIPIIALSQLSRAVEQRGGNKRPLLSDLRESGAIEQDADMVMFLYRPEYYGIEYWDDEDNGSTKDQCEYIVAKNRNGGLVRNRMKFEGRYTLFSDLDEAQEKEFFENLPRTTTNQAFGMEEKEDVPF